MKQPIKQIILITVLALSSLFTLAKKEYDIEDLKALEKSKNWDELLAHIEDVAPKKRTKEWNRILLASLQNILPQVLSENHSYGIRYFAREYMDKYSQAQKNSQLSFKVAKAMRKKVSNAQAIKYFYWGLQNQPTKKFCLDADLQLSLKDALGHSPKSEFAKYGIKIVNSTCLPQITTTIKDAINNSKNGMQNACAVMLKKKALSGITKKRCLRFLKNNE